MKDFLWGLFCIAFVWYLFHNKQIPWTERQAGQAQHTAAVSTPVHYDPQTGLRAANEPIDEGKRILVLRQVAHDSMCHVFTAQLATNMQPFLDMDYYITMSQKRGAELGSKSGLVAYRANLESLTVDWPEGATPATPEDFFYQIQTYTVVYTIYWQTADGRGAGFYQFEHRFNLQTRETLSVRLLQTGDI